MQRWDTVSTSTSNAGWRSQDSHAMTLHELLQDLVVRHAREESDTRPTAELVRAAAALLRRIADGYGRDRWSTSGGTKALAL
jgi:hypothetical protein